MGITSTQWWDQVEGADLAQGDFLPSCLIPCFQPEFTKGERVHQVLTKEYDCIVVTQSCDLENQKATLVAMCPMFSISTYENANPKFKEKNAWERVRTGRVEGLHLMASMVDSQDNQTCYVVDFREIYSLPIEYIKKHAHLLNKHWRLCSPFLEHFSQAFARFFMRVGLPSSIPSFKK